MIQVKWSKLSFEMKLKYIALGISILGILILFFIWIFLGMPKDFQGIN